MNTLLIYNTLWISDAPLLLVTPELSALLVFVLLVLFMVSFFVSGAEVAFFSLTFKDINVIKTRQQSPYKRIIRLLETPKIFQGTLLITNSFARIGMIVISNFLISNYIPLQSPWVDFLLKVVVITTFILLFAEILPKTFASQNNIGFAKDAGWLVEVVYLLFKGMAGSLVNFSLSIEKKLGQRTPAASLEELQHAIDLTTETEATEAEKKILKGIIKFGNITAKQVMRTRMDVNGIEFTTSFSALKKKLENLHYSRIPVFKGNLDDIKGMIQTKDLLPFLGEGDNFNWQKLMRPPCFVHEQKLIEDLLKEFQHKRIHFAVVADEFGGTSGIITLEDILEEVIGDISDEFDEEESGNKKLDELNYLFEGKTMLNDVCRIMDLNPDIFDGLKGESDSLAGLILEEAGEIPSENQLITIGDFDFKILEVNKNRIQKIKVTIKN